MNFADEYEGISSSTKTDVYDVVLAGVLEE